VPSSVSPPPAPSTGPASPPETAERAIAKRRINDILLARFERWALPAMAQRLPGWFTPDTLTGIAILGAFASAIAYYLAAENLAWLHLASFGLVVHWWGDSLDGTLARVRQIRRERYGFFVDHQCDAISATAIFAGMAAGGLMRVELALGMAVGFLLMMNLVNMVTIARDVFKISFAGGGPTELRLIVIAVNTAVWALGPWSTEFWGQTWTPFDLFGLVAVPGLLGLYLFFSLREMRIIARLDPPPPPGRDGQAYDPTGQGLADGARGDGVSNLQGDGV
jgi:phosphatidylglycerophosphate synthase